MKKKKKTSGKITIEDYIKAVKKVDREIQLETNIGWVATNRIHTSKKAYNRKNNKNNYSEEQ